MVAAVKPEPDSYISCVAIRYKGAVYSLPCPSRHHNVIRHIAVSTGDCDIVGEQGFMTDDGRFLDRKDAAELALANGQAGDLKAPPNLYSEDLW